MFLFFSYNPGKTTCILKDVPVYDKMKTTSVQYGSRKADVRSRHLIIGSNIHGHHCLLSS